MFSQQKDGYASNAHYDLSQSCSKTERLGTEQVLQHFLPKRVAAEFTKTLQETGDLGDDGASCSRNQPEGQQNSAFSAWFWQMPLDSRGASCVSKGLASACDAAWINLPKVSSPCCRDFDCVPCNHVVCTGYTCLFVPRWWTRQHHAKSNYNF